MDDKAILERVWCYGDWEEFKYIESIIGKDRAKEIFIERVWTPRSNIRETTIHLFLHYFSIDVTLSRPISRAM